MATSSKGRPLAADRRGSGTTPASKRANAKPPPPRRPPSRRPQPKRGLIARFFLFIWRIFWGVLWRVFGVGAMILACAILFFYVQLPPLNELLDGRSRGSVTMMDRDGAVFAWREIGRAHV